jgi:NTE family protein
MSENYVDRARVGTFEVPVNCRPESDTVRCHVDFSKPVPPVKRLSFQCFVWHIALDEVAGVGVKLEDSSMAEFVSGKSRRGGLVRLERLVTQTVTNWKLSGPENCSSKQLQDGLYTAARVLVRDDEKSRFALCDYILQAGLIKDPTLCKKPFLPTDVEFAVIAKNPSLVNFAAPLTRTENLPVRCVVPQNPLPRTEHRALNLTNGRQHAEEDPKSHRKRRENCL